MQGVEDFDEVVLYGGRGHSEMIMMVLQGLWQDRVRLRAVIDDLNHGFMHPGLNVPVISGVERLARFARVPVLLSMGDGHVRARIAARLADEGAVLATAIRRRPDLVAANVQVGPGCVIYPETPISPNVVLGAGVQVLAQAIGHDVTVGDFATLAIGSILNGHISIGALATIGSGAIICNGRLGRPLRIGDGAVIGVGAVVLRDVPAGARMMGNPAMTVRDWARLQALVRKGSEQG
ncbi:acetyltransferase [Pseudotabrizicola sediminis]|uniref:Acetyltransferase n=1 Tax=Pseudotabrizicola sediminis TaxID=2486418 RepID=A0ABY2KMX1_9RHOB|nr:acetyltransferase [Pseudotabrizicola sediminis]TGD42114.1 acetyltransferase [Pseudotabrizicola sediminis]